PVELAMVALPLGAGEHHVVADREGAARRLGRELVAIDAADAGQDAVAARVPDQVVDRAAVALGGYRELAILPEAAFVAKLREVLAGCLLPTGVSLGDRFGPVLVEPEGAAFGDLGEVGTNAVEVDACIGARRSLGVVLRFDREQRLALHQRTPGRGEHCLHDAAARGGAPAVHPPPTEHGGSPAPAADA